MTTPNPIDYQHSPAKRPRRRGSGWLGAAGLLTGFALSAVEWPALVVFADGQRQYSGWTIFVVMVVTIVATKAGIGYAVDRSLKRSGFLQGVLITIALVPLLAIGTVAVLCGGIRI